MASRVSPERGALAIVTNVGRDAVDAGGAFRRTALSADGEVVWSWRLDAGVKFAEPSVGDGDKKARSPGRARRKPLKPLRRECRVTPVDL